MVLFVVTERILQRLSAPWLVVSVIKVAVSSDLLRLDWRY